MVIRKKLECILLVDDDPDDTLFHRIVLEDMQVVQNIEVAGNGIEALTFLKNRTLPPELIILDINMPRMNGWEFLAEYKHLPRSQKAKSLIIMLTTSANPDDIQKAREMEEVTGFETKPLTKSMVLDILKNYFPDHL